MRYVFYALLVLLNISGLMRGNIAAIIFIAVLTLTLYIANKIEIKKKDGPLQGNDKLFVILTEVFNPVIAGAFYYYIWKKTMPKKASEANKYSFIIVGAEVLLFIVYFALTHKSY